MCLSINPCKHSSRVPDLVSDSAQLDVSMCVERYDTSSTPTTCITPTVCPTCPINQWPEVTSWGTVCPYCTCSTYTPMSCNRALETCINCGTRSWEFPTTTTKTGCATCWCNTITTGPSLPPSSSPSSCSTIKTCPTCPPNQFSEISTVGTYCPYCTCVTYRTPSTCEWSSCTPCSNSGEYPSYTSTRNSCPFCTCRTSDTRPPRTIAPAPAARRTTPAVMTAH